MSAARAISVNRDTYYNIYMYHQGALNFLARRMCPAVLVLSLFLPASHVRSARLAGPNITLCLPHLFVSMYVCASPLITCAISMSGTLLPCDLTVVDFGNLDSCFV